MSTTDTTDPLALALAAMNPEPKEAKADERAAEIVAHQHLTRSFGVQEYGRGRYTNKKGTSHEVIFKRRVGNNLGAHFPAADLVVLLLSGALTDLVASAAHKDPKMLGDALASACTDMSEAEFCDFVDALGSLRP